MVGWRRRVGGGAVVDVWVDDGVCRWRLGSSADRQAAAGQRQRLSFKFLRGRAGDAITYWVSQCISKPLSRRVAKCITIFSVGCTPDIGAESGKAVSPPKAEEHHEHGPDQGTHPGLPNEPGQQRHQSPQTPPSDDRDIAFGKRHTITHSYCAAGAPSTFGE